MRQHWVPEAEWQYDFRAVWEYTVRLEASSPYADQSAEEQHAVLGRLLRACPVLDISVMDACGSVSFSVELTARNSESLKADGHQLR